jgi:hypothetical protein
VLFLNEGLHKAESSILTQIRTEMIGLADFLGAPEVTSACGFDGTTRYSTSTSALDSRLLSYKAVAEMGHLGAVSACAKVNR